MATQPFILHEDSCPLSTDSEAAWWMQSQLLRLSPGQKAMNCTHALSGLEGRVQFPEITKFIYHGDPGNPHFFLLGEMSELINKQSHHGPCVSPDVSSSRLGPYPWSVGRVWPLQPSVWLGHSAQPCDFRKVHSCTVLQLPHLHSGNPGRTTSSTHVATGPGPALGSAPGVWASAPILTQH